MMSFVILIFSIVYPLHVGDVVKEPLVGFDTLSAKKLLHFLDSLDFVSQKLKKIESMFKVYDSLMTSYKEKVEVLEKVNKNLEDEIKVLKKEIVNKEKKLMIERLFWLGGMFLVIILLR